MPTHTNRTIQRQARALAKDEGISYQAALDRVRGDLTIDTLSERMRAAGPSFGHPDLDATLPGGMLHPGWLVTVAGRPKAEGKVRADETATLARLAARSPGPVLWVSRRPFAEALAAATADDPRAGDRISVVHPVNGLATEQLMEAIDQNLPAEKGKVSMVCLDGPELLDGLGVDLGAAYQTLFSITRHKNVLVVVAAPAGSSGSLWRARTRANDFSDLILLQADGELEVAKNRFGPSGVKVAPDWLDPAAKAADYMQNVLARPPVFLVDDIDSQLKSPGLAPGSVTLVAGPPASGTTQLLTGLAASHLATDHNVLYISGDNSPASVQARINWHLDRHPELTALSANDAKPTERLVWADAAPQGMNISRLGDLIENARGGGGLMWLVCLDMALDFRDPHSLGNWMDGLSELAYSEGVAFAVSVRTNRKAASDAAADAVAAADPLSPLMAGRGRTPAAGWALLRPDYILVTAREGQERPTVELVKNRGTNATGPVELPTP